MHGAFCYLASLSARGGSIEAVERLSPLARSRIGLLFDLPHLALKDGKRIEDELEKRADCIARVARVGCHTFVDAHDYPLEIRTASGQQPIAYLVEALRKRGSNVIPVTGTVTDRGDDYVRTIRNVVGTRGQGVCVRIARDELEDPAYLRAELSTALDLIGISPDQVDLVLNFAFIGTDRPEKMRAIALEALEVIQRTGQFRNVALSGTSIPAQLGKRTQGEILRFRRIEYDTWIGVSRLVANEMALAFGDHGIVEIHHAPPGKRVNVPSRIRYTTEREHVIRRAPRGEYSKICRELIASKDFSGGSYSVGDQRLARAAVSLSSKFAPGKAVAHDMNHHLEFVSAQVWREIQDEGRTGSYLLSPPTIRPWLQVELEDN